MNQSGVDGGLNFLDCVVLVSGNDINNAVGRAKNQCHYANSNQHCISDSHPNSYIVPICCKLYNHGHNDAEQ